MTDTLVQILWSGFVVGAFLLALVIPAAIIESKWGREWIDRLRRIGAGRVAQRAEYLERATWHGPERLP